MKKISIGAIFFPGLLLLSVHWTNAGEPVAQEVSINRSAYVEMPDGVKIAVEMWLPSIVKQQHKVPAIVSFTRYWRVEESRGPSKMKQEFINRGFAVVSVDVRGSGASFGYRLSELSKREIDDYQHVLTWLARQSWSNGALATTGNSYAGNSAELAMADAPAMLKVTVPRFTDFDMYAHLLFPGGLPNFGFLDPWSEGVRALDLNVTTDEIPAWLKRKSNIKPVDGDMDKSLLRQALQQHGKNVIVAEQFRPMVYREDLENTYPQQPEDNFLLQYQVSENRRLNQILLYHWASFVDAGTAAGAISRFMGSDAPMRVIIGYWSHGAAQDANPFHEKNAELRPPRADQYAHLSDFFNVLKKPGRRAVNTGRNLYYFTAGENVWKRTDVWPPKGVAMQRYYFRENGGLSMNKPEQKNGKDSYQVNFDVGTGSTARWYQMGDVYYGDRSHADKLLLTYTSQPFESDVEITGHPVVSLNMSSSDPDGAVIVYLEDVAPDGKVTMLTEGNLRLLHRKISNAKPPYPVFGPYHTYRREDATVMQPGKVTHVEFVMLPMSVQIKKGHALRLAIAGHDKDNFSRIPEQGIPVYQFFRQANALSSVDIPVVTVAVERERIDPFALRAN